jgi:hypothetical protein
MVAAPLMALINQGLQIQDGIGIGSAQRYTDGGEPLAKTYGIHCVLSTVWRSSHAYAVARTRLLEDPPNAFGKHPGPLPHEVNFH